MPIWFPELATIVTAAPGTGSTSLLRACSRSNDAVDLAASLGLGDEVDAKHATVRDLMRSTSFSWDATIVTTTRNPFDFYLAEWTRTRTRWASELNDRSSWVHRVDGMRRSIEDAVDNDFVDWIELVLLDDFEAGRQRRINVGHVDEATFVLRMEHFDADVYKMHPRLAAVIGPLPHVNKTDRSRDLAGAYSTRATRIVQTVHAVDIQRFGYTF